jgi:Flp pilus assembly protein TadG
MRALPISRKLKRGSAMVMFTLMLPTVIIPMVGLGVDATMLYIVQAKLSAAVDAAALGAGRLLGTQANPDEISREFLNANFQTGVAGFWGANNLNPSVQVTLGTTKKIHIEASVDVPLLFSRIFGQPKATVTASGESTRRDSRVMLVIDRSNSMNTDDGSGTHTLVITDVVNYAQSFVQKFTASADELGLVVFDGSATVAYPSVRPWDPTITATSTGGPDSSFMDGSSTDMVHQIQAINAGGGTGMAEALWLAYIELQKKHLKDLAAKGVDDRLNSIVLFTDGAPSAVSLYLNDTTNGTSDPNAILSTSPCTNKATSPPKMLGWFAVGGSPPYSGGGFGIYTLASTDTTHTALWQMANAGTAGDQVFPPPTGAFSGCATSVSAESTAGLFGNIGVSGKSDLSRIPSKDLYGNVMTGVSGYTNSHIVGNPNTTTVYNGTGLNTSQVTNAYHWGLAIWNAVDSAASRIRADANQGGRPGDLQNMAVAIYAIGYTGNGGVDDGLLKRVSNDKTSTSYNATQQTGRYIPASDKNQLANAFDTLASIILRLSQ